jgi:hypothetical protein
MSVANDHYPVLGSSRRMYKITKGTSFPNGACRALLVGTPGTCNLTDGDGTTQTDVPLQLGYNPIIVNSIQSGGTADDIWALY